MYKWVLTVVVSTCGTSRSPDAGGEGAQVPGDGLARDHEGGVGEVAVRLEVGNLGRRVATLGRGKKRHFFFCCFPNFRSCVEEETFPVERGESPAEEVEDGEREENFHV